MGLTERTAKRRQQAVLASGAALVWRKSRHSGPSGTCVEVAATSSMVALRDSKRRSGSALAVAPVAWQAFLGSLKSDHLGRRSG